MLVNLSKHQHKHEGFMLFSWSTCLALIPLHLTTIVKTLSISISISIHWRSMKSGQFQDFRKYFPGIYLVSIIHTRYCRSCFCQRLLLRSWWSDVLWLLKKGCFSTRKCLSQTSSTRKLWILLLPLRKTPWVTVCVCVCVCLSVCLSVYR